MCNLVSDVNRKILGQYLHGCLAFKHCLQLYSKLSKKISNKKNFNFVLVKLDKSSFLKYNIMKFIRNSNFFLVQTHVTPFFYFSFSDSNVFGRSVRHCSGIKAIRHLQFNIHSSLLQLKSFHHLSPNYISSFKSMNYYIYFFQIKMFVQDLTTITNEIKRMELPGTSIVPPSSS